MHAGLEVVFTDKENQLENRKTLRERDTSSIYGVLFEYIL